LNLSCFELKSRVTSDLDRPGLSGGLWPVPEDDIELFEIDKIDKMPTEWFAAGLDTEKQLL
jgi:hypothetical protein